MPVAAGTRKRRATARLSAVVVVVALGAGVAATASPAPGAVQARAAVAISCESVGTGAATLAAATPLAASVMAAPAFPEDAGTLTIFAAASLTDAFTAIERDLEAGNPGLDIVYNFAGSQALATQLAQGAAADVFASANLAQMDAATANGNVAGEPVVFVRNELAIVVPAANPAGIETPADLARDGIKLVLAGPEVPAGRYAREAICLMGGDAATYGSGFVEGAAANIVSEEEDVRDVLAKVELGEADAGIAYASDALAGGEAVATIAIPAGVNRIADYPIAAVAGGDEALAETFIGYVLGPDGQAALAEAGFAPVNAAPAGTPAP